VPIVALHHYFVRSSDLARSRHFYCDVLGFEEMRRPAFSYPGYWLGVDGQVQIHMGRFDTPDALSPDAPPASTGAVDHVAFTASDPEAFSRRMRAEGLPTRERHREDTGMLQIFVADPDGVMIELNFPGIATRPAWMGASAA